MQRKKTKIVKLGKKCEQVQNPRQRDCSHFDYNVKEITTPNDKSTVQD